MAADLKNRATDLENRAADLKNRAADLENRKPRSAAAAAALAESRSDYTYTAGEELFNRLTHGIGALLSLVAMVVLVVLSSRQGTVRGVVSYLIYGLSLVVLYASSTLYHSAGSEKARTVLRIVDHATIYLLIAGSYTPITMIALQGAWGWSLFGVVWGLAILGIVLKLTSLEKTKTLSMTLYFLMGWLVVIAVKPMLAMVVPQLLVLMLAGGLFYTLGIIFYAAKKIPFNHGIWHLFVLAGSACHFIGFFLYLT